MPVCRECTGKGRRQIKKELTTRCPDCHGTKRLPDGSDCERCNQWGEIGTGEYKVEEQLCNECWGSGQVTESWVTVWYLLRAVPATISLVGGGGFAIWATWTFLGNPLVTSIVSILVFGLWGGLMVYFARQMPTLGEISSTNWFLIRGIPATVAALGIGLPATWSAWILLQDPPIVAILAVAGFAVWGAVMYYFISQMPE